MKVKDIKVLLIGHGNWGKVHLKTLNCITNNWRVYDKNPEALKSIHDYFGSGRLILRDIDRYDCDAVIIAASSSAHFELAKEFLEAGKHVLVEKPVVFNKADLKELVEIVKARPKQVFMAGHTLMYSPGHKQIIEWANLQTEPKSIILRRMKKNPIMGDDEIYRLAPHDLSILDRMGLLDGERHLCGNTFYFTTREGDRANVVVSWSQDPPIRDFYVYCKNHVLYYNDYDEIAMFDNIKQMYDPTPPLMNEQLAFLNTIIGNNRNNSDIEHTFRVYDALTDLKDWTPLTAEGSDAPESQFVEVPSLEEIPGVSYSSQYMPIES